MGKENDMRLYGLRDKETKNLMACVARANNTDNYCNDVSYWLEEYSTGCALWLVSSKKKAEYVRDHNTKWYIADYDTPTHGWDGARDLEVVEFELTEVTREERVEK